MLNSHLCILLITTLIKMTVRLQLSFLCVVFDVVADSKFVFSLNSKVCGLF